MLTVASFSKSPGSMAVLQCYGAEICWQFDRTFAVGAQAYCAHQREDRTQKFNANDLCHQRIGQINELSTKSYAHRSIVATAFPLDQARICHADLKVPPLLPFPQPISVSRSIEPLAHLPKAATIGGTGILKKFSQQIGLWWRSAVG